MVTDDERREVADRLRECKSHIDSTGWFWLSDELFGTHVLSSSEERLRRGMARLADFIEPPYPDATASYKGWRVQVYDPDGELVSPSNLAADLVRAHEYGKGLGVDREALLALAEDVDEAAAMAVVMDASKWAKLLADMMFDIARRIREALGVQDA